MRPPASGVRPCHRTGSVVARCTGEDCRAGNVRPRMKKRKKDGVTRSRARTAQKLGVVHPHYEEGLLGVAPLEAEQERPVEEEIAIHRGLEPQLRLRLDTRT